MTRSLFAIILPLLSLVLVSIPLSAILAASLEVKPPSRSPALGIYASSSDQAPAILGAVITADARPQILKNFFTYYQSDLLAYSDLIVNISDEHGLDYRLLPAIAMQESTLCKFIPSGSYNCWGYGIYGDQVVKFDSYEDGIRKVARTLAKDYLEKGLNTPNEIMKRYTPPSDGSWADSVSHFLDILSSGGFPEK